MDLLLVHAIVLAHITDPILHGSYIIYSIRVRAHIQNQMYSLFIDFLLTVKATTLIFIPGRASAISSAKEGKSGFIYNLVKS